MEYSKEKLSEMILKSLTRDSHLNFFNGSKSCFFYDELSDLYKFFCPEFSVKGDYIRIKGWVGLFPKRDKSGTLICFDEVDSNGGVSISIRLENFPDASILGIIKKGDSELNPKFMEKIQEILRCEIPNSVDEVRDRIQRGDGWIAMIVKYDVNCIYKKALDIIL